MKLQFLQQENYNDQRDDLFRRRTKRILRESIARQFQNIRFTSNSTELAASETAEWLKEDFVSICGAVVHHGSIRARLPILLKEENSLTIIQIHGKALKGDPSVLFRRQPLGKSIQRYLLKAAYRYYVVKSAHPDASVDCLFMFPQKSFTARSNHLYEKTQGADEIDPDVLEELKDLFVQVDGTDRVREMMSSIPPAVSHPWFTGQSLETALEKIESLNEKGAKGVVQQVHLGCRNCRFRKPVNQHEPGCWDIHFPDANIQNRDRHLFELIGHQVQEKQLIDERYQERVTYTRDFSDAGKVIEHTDRKIAIYHRKAMQLLDAKNRKLPLVFAKKLLSEVANLELPLHFIDFEAATHPVPVEKGKRPYDPVLFQFSCHSLLSDGNLVHTQWLDQKNYSSPHLDIIDGLAKIPNLDKGTIVQFSPFERQAFHKLFNEMKQNRDANEVKYKFLKKVLKIGDKDQKSRFLDISVLLKDGYYNRFMNSGLSLKEILYSVLQVENELGTFEKKTHIIEGEEVNLFKEKDGRLIDPYYQLSDERSQIRDGITAMHAYLCMKAGVLSETQQKLVPILMKRYCSMDSLSLYLIYQHIVKLMEMKDSEIDLVIDG
ncbi:DUF2779 domain-containing protein [Rhodohalobacter sp. 8-1]|uniref:DUF2779 domain-containing protein n=1 Tax=Rhodohalobacter sp. 8-1 TaxID=3131972 RepID=UPI0030EF4F0A